jgi:hypothetical protein
LVANERSERVTNFIFCRTGWYFSASIIFIFNFVLITLTTNACANYFGWNFNYVQLLLHYEIISRLQFYFDHIDELNRVHLAIIDIITYHRSVKIHVCIYSKVVAVITVWHPSCFTGAS